MWSIYVYLFGDDTTATANNSFCLANLTMNKVPKSEKEVKGSQKLFTFMIYRKNSSKQTSFIGYIGICIQASDQYIDWNGIILHTK